MRTAVLHLCLGLLLGLPGALTTSAHAAVDPALPYGELHWSAESASPPTPLGVAGRGRVYLFISTTTPRFNELYSAYRQFFANAQGRNYGLEIFLVCNNAEPPAKGTDEETWIKSNDQHG